VDVISCYQRKTEGGDVYTFSGKTFRNILIR